MKFAASMEFVQYDNFADDYSGANRLLTQLKKRESKSEAFSANPFEYAFLYAPTGDNGAYICGAMVWFAVNTGS